MTPVDSMTMVAPGEALENSQADLDAARELLSACFGTDFAILDTIAECQFLQGELPIAGDMSIHCEVGRELLRRGQPQFIAEHDPLVLLAIPIWLHDDPRYVAIAPFLMHRCDDEAIASAAGMLGYCPKAASDWAKHQPIWSEARLMTLANLITERWAAKSEQEALQREVENLSESLTATYEEISLLYRLTQKLRISDSEEDLACVALQWLTSVLPAEGFVIDLLPHKDILPTSARRSEHVFLTQGNCPVDQPEFSRLLDLLKIDGQPHAIVVNPARRRDPRWPSDRVREMVIVPLMEGEKLHGWLSAINHSEGGEFGSQEASLLYSVAAILGIHAGNLDLYRQQGEFFAGVVRALTSAIDAKDPYTCGHSDRVARVAVCLAEHLGCTPQEQETIYLSGLLHDIGKIGIDDQVLRKPGKLTEAEYEHIKLHAEIGYRILKDIRQLDQVLPVVRHHHEAWDGSGYPFRLAGEEIPRFARIVAVADAFDAMSSDRPYRKGMPDERLDAVLRAGSGHQWDAEVIEAFFAVRDKIRQIARTKKQSSVAELTRIS